MTCRWLLLAGALAALWGTAAAADPGIRDMRYCEVLSGRTVDGKTLVAVWNTLGVDTCPQERWARLTEPQVAQAIGVRFVALNGPRFFTMDRIASDALEHGEVLTAGGIRFRRQAEIVLPPAIQYGDPYVTEAQVGRSATYVFEAGKPMFVLTAPGGTRYVMQSYTRIVDRRLSYADLRGFGQRLTLPRGWTFTVETPSDDVVLTEPGPATVIHDDLLNEYQRVAP